MQLRKLLAPLLTYLAAAAVAVWILAPFAWLLISSLSPNVDLLSRPLHWIPRHLDFSRYVTIFTSSDPVSSGYTFRRALVNSSVVAFLSTLLSMAVGILAAYAFARLRFRGKGSLRLLFLATYMLPPIALVVAMYFILGQLHLRDTVWGLALVYSSFITPYVIWLMSGYFEAIPAEIEEASLVDGCTRLGSLVRVLLPLAVPGLVTTAIFSVLLAWDEFLYALIMTSSVAAKTLPVAIAEFSGQYMVDYGMMTAGGVLAAIPPVLISFLLQRYIISGLLTGAVKG